MNGFDLSTVTNIYLGSTPVKKVYMGTKLIWSTGAFDYSTEYFTIESLEDNNQIGIVDSDRPSISISTDKQTWTTVTPNAAPTYFITLNAGEKVYIKGSNDTYDNSDGYFTSTGQFNVSGNIMSLLYADDFKNKTTLSSSYTFANLFYNANKLISAEHLVLPATTLSYGCYRDMFDGCSSLTKAPELPATTLTSYCYGYMFYGCSSLTTAPELPATALADSCFLCMFQNCTSLNYIKMLATDVSSPNCLYEWVDGVAPSGTFVKDASATLPTGSSGIPDGWTIINFKDYSTEYFTIESLEDNNQIGIVDSDRPSISISTDKRTWTTVTPNAAPTYFITLNAGEKVYIKGSNNAYFDYSWSPQGYFTSTGKFNVSGNIMSLLYSDDFQNQTTLSSANVFNSLFYNANKLISAEHLVLPATTLAYSCYGYMFSGCSSLTTAPELPVTTLANSCYYEMFNGCSSLTTAPELPATTLAESCYGYMFSGCSSLTTAPELPATTLANYCYYEMFNGCSSLTKAPELPATTLANSCYYAMFWSCTSLNYIKMLATDVSADSCIQFWMFNVAPSGTFVKDASATLPTGDSGIPNGWTITNFNSYATEYFTIESLEDNNQIGIVDSDRPSISISTDKQAWTTVTPDAAPTYFITLNTGEKVYIKGSNNAYYDSSWSTKGYFTSTGQFNVSGNIMSLLYEDNFKNQTTLSSSYTFTNLFYNANKLISAEHLVLPATTLTSSCYERMFYGCTSLTKAPELPATTLADFCYSSMFSSCTSLTKAPELPATTLAGYCYSSMFSSCTSLTKAPELPATTLTIRCYNSMFRGCTSFNYIKMLATDVSASNCLYYWVYGVASSGTFIKDASATLPTGINGIPDGWTVETV